MSILLRETIQWDPNTDEILLRYDFAYVDPASHRPTQVIVYALAMSDNQAERDEQIVPVARAAIERMLKRKCGIKRAVENKIVLELPRIARTRYV